MIVHIHVHGFNAYLHTFYYIHPFLSQTANPLPMLAGAAMMNVGVDKVRLGDAFIFKFVCEAHSKEESTCTCNAIELMTTNHCSVIN